MLKAIVTVMDENDKILQANRLIFEENGVPVGFGYITGIEHRFSFTVVTADEETTYKFNKIDDEIKKALLEGGCDIDEQR